MSQLAIGMGSRKDGASAAMASLFGTQNGSKVPIFDGQISIKGNFDILFFDLGFSIAR